MSQTAASGVRPIKYAMVGGGQGAFIGAVHRAAARLDGRWDLVAGAFSSTPERSRASGAELGLDAARCYGTWQELLTGERALPEGTRAEAVVIVTPNHTHYSIAKGCLQHGFHVICDKPLVATVEEAQRLVEAAEKSGLVFAVTYNYTGYPMVRKAREMVHTGAIGPVRKVFVEYHQGWLATDLEAAGQKQAAWRSDPAKSGGGGSIGDIGTHAENLLSFVTGLEITSLAAELTSFVPGRRVDDDATIMLRMTKGARAVITVSQICVGERNNLTLRVHGETGSLFWQQERPEELTVCKLSGERLILSRGDDHGPIAAAATRLPSGHPEGFLEAFGNLYRGAADAVTARKAGTPAAAESPAALVPGVRDGLRGVQFVDACLRSADANAGWVSLDGE